jgi:hypothetical protein
MRQQDLDDAQIASIQEKLYNSDIDEKDEYGYYKDAGRQIYEWDKKPVDIAFSPELQRQLLGDEFDTLKPSRGFIDAFKKEYGLGREHFAEARRRARWAQGKSENAPRWDEMTESYPLNIRLQELRGKAPKTLNDTLNHMGMGLEPAGNGRRAGQLLATLANDLTQDTSRGFYWLLNALQATGAVITETTLGNSNPDLFKLKPVTYKDPETGIDTVLNIQNDEDRVLAIKLGFLDTHKNTRRGIRIKPSVEEGGIPTNAGNSKNKYLMRPRFNPGDLNSLLIPTGAAINTGLGLMSPFGGIEGYEAAVPDPNDKTKTSNAIAEVAAKYFLGRTGNLLPYDEFVKVRPDVSPAEYRAYKAFKYDKELDLNPFDGDFTLPTGVVKGTTEGIHGPEIQFLGRGLPLTTGIIPFGSALVGTKMGVKRNRPIRGGLIGGMAGLAVGQGAGNLIEGERRRRNKAENESYGEL